MAGAPAGITEKRKNRKFAGGLVLVERMLIQFEPFAFAPFERCQHQLIVSDGAAKKNRDVRQILRRHFTNQFGHALIERAIDDHADGAIVGIVR